MKKYLWILTLGLLGSCSTDEAPPQLHPEEQPASLEAPQLSRSLAATDAAIAAFTKEGVRTHLWKLEKNGDQWHWATGTTTTLQGWDTLVCVVPYIQNLNAGAPYVPSQNSTLLWGKLGKEEQNPDDGRFYFKSLTHRLAQVFVEVDRYVSGDELRMYLATQGNFHALTGGFSSLVDGNKTIIPEPTDSGTYVYQFSIVPQTFRKGENLLRYKDVYSNYYDYYYYKAEEDLVVPANHRLNIRLKWNENWEFGDRYYTTVSISGVSLNKTEIVLDTGHTEQLTATVRPSNATDKTVTWSSDDPGIATVSSSGLVTAVTGGTAYITAKAGNYTATCKVVVRAIIGGDLLPGDDLGGDGEVDANWGENNNNGGNS